jgi:gas vesicle protein
MEDHMTRARLITLLLTLALVLASAPAVMAQDESPAAEGETSAGFDPATIPEANQDELLIAYLALREEILAAGVAAEDVGAAMDWLAGEAANLSPEEAEALMAGEVTDEVAEGQEEVAEGQEEVQDEIDEAKEELEEEKEEVKEKAD